MTIIGVPYHLDEYLPDLDLPLQPNQVVTAGLPAGDPWERMAVLQSAVAGTVAGEVASGACPVVMSGDCNTSAGIMAGLQRAGADPAIVWFDGHGDVQTLETTTSGYLGGLALRLLIGYRPELIATRLGLRPVPEERIVLAGARDLDPPEVTYLAGAAIRRREVAGLTAADLPAGPLYVHVDLDVIDAAALPGLRFPVPGGPDAAQLAATLRVLLATGQVAALGISCSWHPGHASARHVAAQLSAVLLRGVRAHQAQRGGAGRPAGLQSGPRRVQPLRRDPAELPGHPRDGRLGVGRPELPHLFAVRRGQLAPHLGGRLAGQAQRVRQRSVRQPGDVLEPVRVGEVGAERPGDVQPVRPVLG
jgi:arginase